MRPTAIIPVVCCTAALILSFLCLFAGRKVGFMEDYHLLTLNTSRIGTNLLSDAASSSNPLSSLFNNITSSIESDLNEIAADVAEQLGIDDFYSAHMLDYCYGDYTPTSLANATVSANDIHKNVSGCSKTTAMYAFDPTDIIEQALNKSGVDVTLADLDWPADIQTGIDALRIVSKTAFVLYCLAIGLIFVSLVVALPALFSAGRLAACLNVMVASLALLAIGLASALITAMIVQGGNIVNKYGSEIGVEAHKGGKFLAITWAATALMFVTLGLWTFETCCGHRRKTRDAEYVPKHG